LYGDNNGNNVEQIGKSGSPIGTSCDQSCLNTTNVTSTEAYPDVLLLTHIHDDHIEHLLKKFPEFFKADSQTTETGNVKSDNRYVLNRIEPDSLYEIGPFSVIPI
jgi:Cft2 family RNA processing exonuclease